MNARTPVLVGLAVYIVATICWSLYMVYLRPINLSGDAYRSLWDGYSWGVVCLLPAVIGAVIGYKWICHQHNCLVSESEAYVVAAFELFQENQRLKGIIRLSQGTVDASYDACVAHQEGLYLEKH